MATAIDQTDAFRAMAIAAFNVTKRVGARAVFIGLFVIWMLTSLGVGNDPASLFHPHPMSSSDVINIGYPIWNTLLGRATSHFGGVGADEARIRRLDVLAVHRGERRICGSRFFKSHKCPDFRSEPTNNLSISE